MKLKIKNLEFGYAKEPILKNINIDIKKNAITAISGPSGSGKSTLLMCMNRLWEEYEKGIIKGSILANLNNSCVDIYEKNISLPMIRQKIGMVFQMPNPFPMSIEKNLLFPFKLKTSQSFSKNEINLKIISVLKKVHLYDEVKNRMQSSAVKLSGGQQQRLCIARALMQQPEILLLDEPTSSLDSKAENKIETLLTDLKNECTIVIVSHSTSQIERIADTHIKMEQGRVINITKNSSLHI